MKGAVPIVAIAAIVIILGIFYSAGMNGLIGQGSLVTDSSGASCTLKEGTKLVPLIGYYKCEVTSPNQVLTYQIGNAPDIDILTWTSPNVLYCGNDGFTDSCIYTISNPKKDTWFFGLLTSVTRLKYSYETGWFYVENVQNIPENLDVKTLTIPNGRSLRLIYQKQVLTLNGYEWQTISDAKIGITEKFNGYSLVQYGPTSGRNLMPKANGCYVTNSMKLCTDGIDCALKWDKVGQLTFEESTNYLEDWAYSPSDYGIYDYNGGKVYCSGGKLYDYALIKLSDGNCYGYPKDVISDPNVKCCPNSIAGNAICGNDFKWHTQSDPTTGISCISDLQCGGGLWQPDMNDVNMKTMVRGRCISSKCSFDTMQTGCATDLACPSGKVCNVNQYSGVGECVTQAGSGGVTTPREPSGTGTTEGFDIFKYITMFIVAFIVSGILVFLVYWFTPLKKTLGTPLNFLIATIAMALLLTVFFTMPVASLTASLVG